MNLYWEAIKCKPEFMFAYRTKIPGGWLIFIGERIGGNGAGSAVFYPDPGHRWDGNSLP